MKVNPATSIGQFNFFLKPQNNYAKSGPRDKKLQPLRRSNRHPYPHLSAFGGQLCCILLVFARVNHFLFLLKITSCHSKVNLLA
jgi:hypothetical protein